MAPVLLMLIDCRLFDRHVKVHISFYGPVSEKFLPPFYNRKMKSLARFWVFRESRGAEYPALGFRLCGFLPQFMTFWSLLGKKPCVGALCCGAAHTGLHFLDFESYRKQAGEFETSVCETRAFDTRWEGGTHEAEETHSEQCVGGCISRWSE